MEKFNREDIEYFLPDTFKGLSKQYLLDCIFNDDIQRLWIPEIGDIIVSKTGNIFVISNIENYCEDLGGTLYFYSGFLASTNNSNYLSVTKCYTMNKSGKWISYNSKGKLEESQNCYHNKLDNYKFVPYPHEINRLNILFTKKKKYYKEIKIN